MDGFEYYGAYELGENEVMMVGEQARGVVWIVGVDFLENSHDCSHRD